MNINEDGRIPLIALDYNKRQLAQKKELMVDYETGNLYVVSATDKTKIFDITSQIVKLINISMPGDSIVVNIDGVGKVNLKDYLDDFRANSMQGSSEKEKNLIANYFYDYDSIVNKNGKIQVNDFDKAEERSVPTKINGVLRWIDPDCNKLIDKQAVYNSTITLKAHYTETDLAEGCIVSLHPISGAAVSKLIWKVNVSDVQPSIKFSTNNVLLEFDTDMSLKPHTVNVFEFQTWDNGLTWLETVRRFNKDIAAPATKIDYGYLGDNYYTKPEVEDLIKWKNKDSQNL